jgi:hypothetical protein
MMKKLMRVFSMIPREYSWGKLQITKEAFELFLTHGQISAEFIDVVKEFHSKISEDLSSTGIFASRFLYETLQNVDSELDPVLGWGRLVNFECAVLT